MEGENQDIQKQNKSNSKTKKISYLQECFFRNQMNEGDGEMVQVFKVLIALAEDAGSFPSI